MLKLFDLVNGDSVPGIINDGFEHTPQLHGQLIMDKEYGPQLVIFFREDKFSDSENKDSSGWHLNDKIPECLEFVSLDGAASFHGAVVIRRRHNFVGLSEIRLRPTTVVYGSSAAEETTPLEVIAVHSTIENLGEWLGQGGLTTKYEFAESGKMSAYEVRVEVPPTDELNLSTMRVELSTPWRSQKSSGQVVVGNRGQISTYSVKRAAVGQHLDVHKRLRDFLVLSSGRPTKILDHTLQLTEDSDAEKFIHFSTVSEQRTGETELVKPIDHLIRYSNIIPSKLRLWLETDSSLAAKSGPLIQLLERERFTIVDRVIYSGMVTESIGESLPEVLTDTFTHTGKLVHYTYVLRCLAHSRIDLTGSPLSIHELAKAIALNYNKTKHYQPSKTPDPSVSAILGRVMTLALRKLLIRVTSSPLISDYPAPHETETDQTIRGLANISLDSNGWPSYKVVTEEMNDDD